VRGVIGSASESFSEFVVEDGPRWQYVVINIDAFNTLRS
jgi:hypothetical protein